MCKGKYFIDPEEIRKCIYFYSGNFTMNPDTKLEKIFSK